MSYGDEIALLTREIRIVRRAINRERKNNQRNHKKYFWLKNEFKRLKVQRATLINKRRSQSVVHKATSVNLKENIWSNPEAQQEPHAPQRISLGYVKDLSKDKIAMKMLDKRPYKGGGFSPR